MPFAKGTPKPAGSGRKKGVLNRQTLHEIAADRGVDPRIVLLDLCQDSDKQMRFRAAAELMPYLYPTLRAVEVSGIGGGAIEGRTIVEVRYEDTMVPE